MEGVDAISELAERLVHIQEDVNDMLRDSYNEIAPILEDENIAQLQQGQRSDESILPNYSFTSVHLYGKPAGPIKLYETGDFYHRIKVTADEQGITVEGLDPKTEMLEFRYGPLIIGIMLSRLEQVKNDYIVELMQDKLRVRLTR